MNNRNWVMRVTGAAMLVLVVGGCSDLSDAIGLSRRPPPDEFQVVTNAPLSVPPEFTLRPPTPGEDSPQAVTAQAQAREAATGSAAALPSGATAGEQALLAGAGAVGVNPGIRQAIDSESRILADEDSGTSLADILLFWRSAPPPSGQIIDAAAEADRIRATQAEGRPINDGETPIIDRSGGPIRLF